MADQFKELTGRSIESIEGAKVGSERITFECADGAQFALYHSQDCCETVEVNEVIGDIADLLGSPILLAEEVSNNEDDKPDEYTDSWTWTFYKLSTIKGSVTLRWLGTSNGYYSESVDFARLDALLTSPAGR